MLELHGVLSPESAELTGRPSPESAGLTGRISPVSDGLTGRISPVPDGLTGRIASELVGLTGALSPESAGLTGALSSDLLTRVQTKTATPTDSEQVITPDAGYAGLSLVVVKPIPSNYGKVTWTGYSIFIE